MVRSATWTAVSASISTPVRAVHSTVARTAMREAFSSGWKSTATEVSGTGWQSGISSEVRLAAWIAAMRATPSTSPFFAVPERTMARVSGFMRMWPSATATRRVSSLAPTSTIRAAPRSSKWVSFWVIIHSSSSPTPSLSLRPFIALVGAAFFSQAVLAQGLPDLGDISSASLSESQERTIGNRILREVYADPTYLDDPELTDYVTSVGQRLLAVADNPPRDMTYFVVRDDSVNAFALVGGHIGIHTGLIMLTQNESELAGVMAHETGHILQKHQARFIHNASRAQWTSLAALALAVLASRAGGSGQGAEAALVGAQALQIQNQIDFTRENEREADRVGFQLLSRAGYDPRAMQTFFERMLRANRLNEYKGMPSYFRTHPLTTERIAEMADRAEHLPGVMYGVNALDSLDYRIMRAKVIAESGSANEAVKLFRTMLEDQTVMRPRENVYGLAYALRRAHDFDGAWKTLQPIRANGSHPAFELLAGEILGDMHRSDEAIALYRTALKANPGYRALAYAYLDQMLQAGQAKDVLADLDDRLRQRPNDWRLYELQARAFGATGRPIGQHRAQAEAYYRRNNLPAAVDQLELAVKQTRGSDFYEMSIAESRLRELRVQLENERAAEKALKIT